MKIYTSLLAILLISTVVVLCSAGSSAANRQHYIDNYVKHIQKQHNIQIHTNTQPLKHNCVHDELDVKPTFVEGVKRDGSSIYDNINYLNNNVKSTGNESLSHPLKIYFNTTYLNPDQNKTACFNEGDVILIGPGSSTSSCDRFNPVFPCLWTCQQEDLISQELTDLIVETILPEIQSTFSTFLTSNGNGTTIINQQDLSCKDEPIGIPRNVRFDGDFMLYVTAHPTSPRTVAYGAMCVLVVDDAPVIGYLNFNPMNFTRLANSPTQDATWNTFVGIALHETVHTLGFSQGVFKHFLNRTTSTEIGDNGASSISFATTYNGVTPSGETFTRTRYYISTPNVKAIAQTHFNCTSLIGAELENIGTNSISSHWKATAFGEEMMLGFALPYAPLTNLTLALLYDSGWYGLTNLDKVDQLVWGKNTGCGFAETCNSTTWNYPGYWNETFANGQYVGCSATRSGVGSAYVQYQGAPLPLMYQHFQNSSLGSTQNFRDYCLATDIIYNTPGFNYYCNDQSQNATSQYEVLGATSRCFEFNQDNKGFKPSCFPHKCQGSTLSIQVGQEWKDCTNGQITFNTGGLIVNCPTDFCKGDAFPTEPSDQPVQPVPTQTPTFPNITQNITMSSSTTGVNSATIISFNVFIILILSTLAVLI